MTWYLVREQLFKSDDVEIYRANEVKFLGVIIDE